VETGRDDWERRWAAGDTPWDLGRAPAVLDDLLAGLADGPLCVLVPGAGAGHDALAWARAGHVVTAVDVAPTALVRCRESARKAGLAPTLLVADLFALPQDLRGAFDVVWEQTCFCAIPPTRRPDYARAMADVLRPRGTLHALLWNHGRPGGPPHDVRREDAQRVFAPFFEPISLVDVTGSPAGRAGEFLYTLRKRGP
jgi:SAM-dependent methyltransferase